MDITEGSTVVEKRFQRNECFDSQFENIPNLKWYPYVGKKFGETGKRLMVFAHNIPISSNDYDSKLKEWEARDYWSRAETIEEYTYWHGWWTKSFRSFVKGAVGLSNDYRDSSYPEITTKIDAFIRNISYINFIQDLVKSENPCAFAQPVQIEVSKKINREILRILGITHCICWGKPTYNYVRSLEGFKMLSEDKYLGKRGFSSCIIEVGEGQTMQCLRTYHPSMPRFGALQKSTHEIIASFLSV